MGKTYQRTNSTCASVRLQSTNKYKNHFKNNGFILNLTVLYEWCGSKLVEQHKNKTFTPQQCILFQGKCLHALSCLIAALLKTPANDASIWHCWKNDLNLLPFVYLISASHIISKQHFQSISIIIPDDEVNLKPTLLTVYIAVFKSKYDTESSFPYHCATLPC